MVKRSTSEYKGASIKDSTNTFEKQDVVLSSGNKSTFTYIAKTDVHTHDLDGSDLGTQIIVNKYEDGYGNLTSQELSSAIQSGLGFSSVKVTKYKNDSEKWLLGLPESEQETKVAPTYGTIKRKQDRTYDPTTGLLLTETQEKGDALLEVKTIYDRPSNFFGLVHKKTQYWQDPLTKQTLERDTATIEYDSKGRFIESITNALNHKETRSYDPATGIMLSQTDQNELAKSWKIDGFGRVTKEIRADKSYTLFYQKQCDRACPPLATVATISDHFFNDMRMAVPSISYRDSAGHVIQEKSYSFDGAKILTDQRFDDQGRLWEVAQPRYECDITCLRVNDDVIYLARRQTYDALGRLVHLETLDEGNKLAVSKTQYKGLTQIHTNAKNEIRTETRDVLGQLRNVLDANDGNTSFEYDAFGSLKQVKDPNGNLTNMSYDGLGRKIELNDPNLGIMKYVVDPIGRVLQQTSPKQSKVKQSVSMHYDFLDRMTSRIEPDLMSYWTYDTASHGKGLIAIATTKNANNDETYRRVHAYDALSRPTSITQTLSDAQYVSTTSYDGWGRLASQQHQRKVETAATIFSQRYNKYGYLLQVLRRGKEIGAKEQVLWQANTQDAAHRVRHSSLGNGLEQTRGYNNYSARMDDARLYVPDISTSSTPKHLPRLTEAYSFDSLGNVKQRTQFWDKDGFIEDFDYDDLSRIKTSKIGQTTQSFTYDKVGNILTKGNVSNGATYQYPNQGVVNGVQVLRPHAVTNISGIGSFDYDDNGNLKSGAGRSLTWTSFDMPESISKGTQKSSFVYGPEHQRTRQDKSGGISIIYAGSMEVEGPLNAPTSIKTYWPNGLGLEIEKGVNTELFWRHHDRLGSPIAISDANGHLVEKMAYDTWGKRRNLNENFAPDWLDGQIDNKGFTGHEMLDQLDLVHMNGRVYDPFIAKFVSADPHITDPLNGQNYNRYSYVLNNPTNLTDPTGFDWTEYIPVYGSVKDFEGAIGAGHFWAAAAFGTLAIVDGATLGVGSFATTPLKSLVKQEVKHEIKAQLAKEAAEQAARVTAASAKAAEQAAARQVAERAAAKEVENGAKAATAAEKGALKERTGAKRGPKTDRDAPHNKMVRESAEKELAANPGSRIVAGGGEKAEKLLATPGGVKEGRRPDTIIERADGSQFGINVGKTKADGTPIKREADALKDLNQNANLPTKYVPYDKPIK